MSINTNNLAKTISSRTSAPVRKIQSKNNYVYDAHVHIFDRKCINEGYFLIRLAKEKIFPRMNLFPTIHKLSLTDDSLSTNNGEVVYDLIRDGNDLSSWREIEKALRAEESAQVQPLGIWGNTLISRHLFLAKLITKRKMKTVYKLFKKKCALTTLDRFKKKDVITCALMMDIGKTWNGEVNKTPSEQIEELRNLAKRESILPFLAIDPRRALDSGKENLSRLFEQAFAQGEGAFFGIKMYPALGYLPSDYRLDEIFSLCEKYEIPIVTHCGGETVSTFKTSIVVFSHDPNQPITISRNTREEIAFYLNDPAHWEKVLEKYPKLKLNLAHFGNWSPSASVDTRYTDRIEKIKELMHTYPNVYADFSYSLIYETAHDRFTEELADQTILNRTLFGTDYWVVLFKENIQKAQKEFFDNMPDQITSKITRSNPDQFLFNRSGGVGA